MIIQTGNLGAEEPQVASTRMNTYWLSKIFTYLLNSQIDAQIADAIQHHLKHGRLPSGAAEVEQRATEFINIIGERPDHDMHLMLTAYTVERVNGLADYMFAHLLTGLLPDKKQTQVAEFLVANDLEDAGLTTYDLDSISWRAIIAIGTRILAGKQDDIKRYAEKHDFTLTSSRRDVARAIQLVQQQNIQSNIRNVQLLRSNVDTPYRKINAIRKAAQMTPHTQTFINTAARTQRAACNWDRLFSWFVLLRFGVNRRVRFEQ